jgi:Ca2+-binding RTX toxin-like protein
MPIGYVGVGFLNISFTADTAATYHGEILNELLEDSWVSGTISAPFGETSFSAGLFGFFGATPSSLDFRLGDGMPGTITITRATINGVDVTAHFNKLVLHDGDRTASINVAGIPAYAFGRTEPDPAEFGPPDITGTAGNDTILLAVDSRTIVDGGGGNDLIIGGAGDDVLMGGAGLDTLFGSAGDDVLTGGDDRDIIFGGDGADILYGGLGDDLLNGGKHNDVLNGGAGRDALIGGAGDDILYGEEDDDTLLGDAGFDLLFGDAGNDVLLGGGGADILLGGSGNDYLSGGAGDDIVLHGEDGDDVIEGGAGNDSIEGDTGNDIISGGVGNDTINAGEDDDIAWGDDGNDVIEGGGGNDTLLGGPGADILYGDDGDDIIFGSGLSLTAASQIVLANPGVAFSMTTGSFYKIVDSTLNYSMAAAAAAATTLNGAAGHLAVITSAAEQAVINTIIANAGGAGSYWLGASDANTVFTGEGTWTWQTGPEAGLLFSNGAGASMNGLFAYWAGGAPANSTGLEDYAALDSGNSGLWTANPSTATFRYIIEWDGMSFGTDTDSDTLFGGDGNDFLYGGTGGSTFDGGAGDDRLYGGSGNDTFKGSAGNDTFKGGGGVDTYDASDATESLVTTALVGILLVASSDGYGATGETLFDISNIIGGAHDDTIEGTNGTNVLAGGDGSDTLTYENATAGVTVSLALTSAQNTGGAGTDTVSGFENLTGSAFNDTLTGDANANILAGGAGADLLVGAAGNDTLNGQDGNDTLRAGAGANLLDGGTGTDTADYSDHTSAVNAILNYLGIAVGIHSTGTDVYTFGTIENLTGGSAHDTLTGDNGSNVLTGNAGDDTLAGQGGDDTLYGGLGNDRLDGGAGIDYLYGGDGSDTATYANASAAVTASLPIGLVIGSSLLHALDGIENLTGSAFNDMLTGDANANILAGGAGADLLVGAAGNDTLNGQDGNDTLDGGSGNNTLDGGAGSDTVLYSSAPGGVIANLDSGTVAGWNGYGGTDTLIGIENLTGSEFNDWLVGTTAANLIHGGGGNDLIGGGDGNDTLYGGLGIDTVFGDAGNDTIYGGGGNAVLSGDAGSDILYSESTAATTVAAILSANSGIGLTYLAQTGNFYRYIDSGTGPFTYALAHNEATSAPLSGVGGTAGDGHVLTINSQMEFDFVRNTINIGGATWMGVGDDGAVNTYVGSGGAEGTWKYLTGPEAGITFYTGSAARLGYFVNPSNFSGTITGNDDYAMMRSTDVWAFQSGGEGNHRIIEWEGQRVFDGVTKDTVTLDGGAGADTLYGGDGKDVFLFMAATAGTGANADTIFNFNVSMDVLNIADLLTGYTEGVSNPNDFVFFKTVGLDTQVKIDTNGGGGMVEANYAHYATIKGLTSIDVDDWAHRGIIDMS